MTSDGGFDVKTYINLGGGFHLQLILLESDTTRQSKAFSSLPSCGFPAPIPPTSSVLTAHTSTPTCTHVCGKNAGIIETACCVAHLGSIHEPNCGNSNSRRPNQCMPRNRGWAANPNTLDRCRGGPHLCPAPPFILPLTQVLARLSTS
jgi:hypothetical protein